MRNFLSQAMCGILLALVPTAVYAGTAEGTVQAQGIVTVNGTRVPGSTAVFDGDKIQTAANSTATITAHGTMVQLSPNTSATVSDRTLNLGCGSTSVTTSTGEAVHVAGMSITPSSQGTAKFQVTQSTGNIKVTAQEGSIVVDDGAKHVLSPGQSFVKQSSLACGGGALVDQSPARVLIPVAIGSGIVAYCGVNHFCSQASPSAP